jgi:porin
MKLLKSRTGTTWVLAVTALLALTRSPVAQTLDETSAIAGNPSAVNVAPGSGALGRILGVGPDSGVRLGGVLVSNGNTLLNAGNSPGSSSYNNLLVVDMQADLEKIAHIAGATFGVALLRFDGQPSNQQAGLITGYNGLPGAPPLDRTELYELWWRQSLFEDKLIVRIGKTVPTYDFGNVTKPVPVKDPLLQIPTTSGLLYTPLFVNPTILGALPGYYNSAYGITTTIAPTERIYISLGIYDGNSAHGVQTGLRAAPTFNGNQFRIGEVGTAWALGHDHLPGSFAAGVWGQTGSIELTTKEGTIIQDGTHGIYAFGSQRLWRGDENGGASGVSGFVQFGANDSRTMIATQYVGFGLTAFGIIPGRPRDSLGAGLAWSWLNHNLKLRPTEIMLQMYDQIHVIGDVYLQPAITVAPVAGEKTARQPPVAFTLQSTILF